MTSSRLTLADYRALAEFRYRLRRFLRFSDRAAWEAGLESHQHQLLLAVKGMPEQAAPTVGAVAERLQTKHHSTVALVDRMEARGLVRRLRTARDRRVVLISLTARGEALLARLSEVHRAELQSVGRQLRRALDTVIADMEGSHAAAGR